MRDIKRKCRDYERPWRDFCVDKNLQDGWLERLNDLQVFNLVNICEGHPERSRSAASRYAHIYLKIKGSFLRGAVSQWEELRPIFLHQIHTLFHDAQTTINFDLSHKIRTGRGRLVYQEELDFKIRSRQAKADAGLDPATQAWFERTITRTEALDQAVYAWLQEDPRQN
jgi:hypothetical protein